MPWFKVDDSVVTHPKFIRLSKPARALWLMAGAWSASQLTDGFVPTHALPVLGGKQSEAQMLVSRGLWEEVDGGWRFHDWEEYQPTREAVLERRARGAERLRRHRERRREEEAQQRRE